MFFNSFWNIDYRPWTTVKRPQSSPLPIAIGTSSPHCVRRSFFSEGGSPNPKSTSKPRHGLSSMVYGLCSALLLCLSSLQVHAQTDSLNKKRLLLVGGTTAVGYTGTMLILNQAWYANYPRSSFHFINDNAEWLQMDKIGHAWSAQGFALAGIEAMKWTGMPRKKAIWVAGIGAMFFQTSLETFDGFSAEWGASGGDMIANTVGTALAVGQQLLWDEQRIQLKYSFHLTNYAEKRPNLLGDNFYTRILKDYNGQTYWLSVNPWSFAKGGDWPKWLNLSVGYGADGMVGGHSNTWIDANGIINDYSAIPRQRQLYFSLDIDMQRLPLKNPLLQRLARLANVIKIPAPTLMYQEGGKWQFYPLYF